MASARAESSSNSSAAPPEDDESGAALATLTAREREVLRLLARGLTKCAFGKLRTGGFDDPASQSRCAAHGLTQQHRSSSLGTPSCRTFDVDTTNWAWTYRPRCGSPRRSRNSPTRSDPHPGSDSACPPIAQDNTALSTLLAPLLAPLVCLTSGVGGCATSRREIHKRSTRPSTGPPSARRSIKRWRRSSA